VKSTEQELLFMNNHDRKTIQKMIEHCNHIIDYPLL